MFEKNFYSRLRSCCDFYNLFRKKYKIISHILFINFHLQDLVRTRRYVKKFMLMRANIQAVSLKIQTLKSQAAMANAMKGVTKAMGNMNKQMKLPEIQKIMMEFEKQSEIMDMKGEMMEDAIGKNFSSNEEIILRKPNPGLRILNVP